MEPPLTSSSPPGTLGPSRFVGEMGLLLVAARAVLRHIARIIRDRLQRAAAFVTHGGMNSVSESLRMGVPMVTVPQMGEQEIVSRRVELP